jgi:hypothetical protein
MQQVLKHKYLLVLTILVGMLGCFLLRPGVAHAYTNNDLNESQVPDWVTKGYPGHPYEGRCTQFNGVDNAAGQGSWVSTDAGNWFNQTAATVSSSTTTLNLNAVFSGVWCVRLSSNVDSTRHRVGSITASGGASVSGIAPGSVIGHGYPGTPYDINGAGTGGFWPAVAVEAVPIVLNIPSGLSPGDHTFYVNMNGVTRINHFSNGSYVCVGGAGQDVTSDPNNFGICAPADFSFPVTVTVLPPPDRPLDGGLYAWGCDLGDYTYSHRNNNNYTVRAGLLGSMQDPDYDFTQVHVYINHVDPANLNQQFFVGSYDASEYPLTVGGVPIGVGKPPYGGWPPPTPYHWPDWHDWFVVPKADLDRFGDVYQHDVFVYGIGRNPDGSTNGNNPEIFHKPDGGRASITGCAQPACSVTINPGSPEVGVSYTV